MNDVFDEDTIFEKSILTREITVHIQHVDSDISTYVLTLLRDEYEGRCIEEGYIKQGSAKILTLSCGKLIKDYVQYMVTFECMIFLPVESMRLKCYVKNITKAGIRALISPEQNTPAMIFLARDHHIQNEQYISSKIGDQLLVRVIGNRFELNDEYISILSELI